MKHLHQETNTRRETKENKQHVETGRRDGEMGVIKEAMQGYGDTGGDGGR